MILADSYWLRTIKQKTDFFLIETWVYFLQCFKEFYSLGRIKISTQRKVLSGFNFTSTCRHSIYCISQTMSKFMFMEMTKLKSKVEKEFNTKQVDYRLRIIIIFLFFSYVIDFFKILTDLQYLITVATLFHSSMLYREKSIFERFSSWQKEFNFRGWYLKDNLFERRNPKVLFCY